VPHFLGNKALVEAPFGRVRHHSHNIRIQGPLLRDAAG
jgi:hypothetical protein